MSRPGTSEASGNTDQQGGLAAGYGPQPLDEAVDPLGAIRPAYRQVLEVLDRLGADELAARHDRLDAERLGHGVTFPALNATGTELRSFPMDLVPRIIDADSWAFLARGATQRVRALNAFLTDVYRPTDEPPAIVAEGIVPDAWVRRSPGYLHGARDITPGGQVRATVTGLDLLTDERGDWVVLEDNLRVPSGLAYSRANRVTAAAVLPELTEVADRIGVQGPDEVGRMLHRALLDQMPIGCPRTMAQVVVLSDGPENSAWYEHQRLAELMGVPVITPADLVPDEGGGVAAMVDGAHLPIDVVYRRLGDDELVHAGRKPTAGGDTSIDPVRRRAADLLVDAARAGRVSIANAPGNGVADDKAIYAFVGPMIRFYLGEDPILRDVGTWVLADPNQYEAVRGRMHELVVKPIDGSGGQGVMIGPDLSEERVARLEAEVAAAPHRYIAQDVIRFSTHPTLIGGHLVPRHVDLRMFVLSGEDTVVAPVALTRVALESEGLLVNSSQGGGSKDTWLLR
ncbi:circularly permuted type 2 ATP-grasp protein [Nakamurella leprariae]|uniref:Circularly permuted type 2 ATP-grasp protein n=1 Tax=Nakamurella leprariae TaxID=2803911 RepID=A0A939C083_9ACTN|nr:circularly permuted type 2 ATP-grasp protein [Nakamurella leprariae]MBM9468491.1 circularly permuted type 2 ATP-grasp protein [Nakamurella leprariae]